MNELKYPINSHEHYHAHVYFEQETITLATALCKSVGDLFALKIGRIHQKSIGPHPKWSCQISFSSTDFEHLIAWLENHRKGLSVLVHALTGDNLQDHTEHAYWLGDEVELSLDLFRS
jgi:DOPA 4,5-dioxygenase